MNKITINDEKTIELEKFYQSLLSVNQKSTFSGI